MNCHLAITRVKFVYLIDACVLRRKLNRRFHNKRQLETDRIFTCEKHFHPHEIEICKFKFLYLFIFQ